MKEAGGISVTLRHQTSCLYDVNEHMLQDVLYSCK